MQEKSNDLVNVSTRLECLRTAKGMTWKELAADLGISYTMIYFVRKGRKSLGVKKLQRLREAEIGAGLRSPTKPSFPMGQEEKDRQFSYERLLELRRRWHRRPADHDQITLAVRILFSKQAEKILDWVKHK